MDIEWAKDADDEQIYIIQARPETVASRRSPTSLETYSLKGSAPALVTGRAVGEKIAFGPVRVIAEAPANYPEIARYLTQLGIDSISVNPSSILRTMQVVSDAEATIVPSSVPSEAAE